MTGVDPALAFSTSPARHYSASAATLLVRVPRCSSSPAAVEYRCGMQVPPATEAFVDRVSAGDGDAAAEWVHDDAEFDLPGNESLPTGSAGARSFASRHGAVAGRLISVELEGAEALRENCWVTRLVFVNREIASGETMYEMEVGGVFELRDARWPNLSADGFRLARGGAGCGDPQRPRSLGAQRTRQPVRGSRLPGLSARECRFARDAGVSARAQLTPAGDELQHLPERDRLPRRSYFFGKAAAPPALSSSV
jgi:hypothetical protein